VSDAAGWRNGSVSVVVEVDVVVSVNGDVVGDDVGYTRIAQGGCIWIDHVILPRRRRGGGGLDARTEAK
jgi:hypothetical protein